MFKRFCLMPILIVLLAACGTSSPSNGGDGKMSDTLSVPTDGLTKGEGFIIRLETDRALVNDTYFTVDNKTHLVSLGDGGEKKLAFEDLEPGMKVEVYHSGMMLQSFPGQGYANLFVVKRDEESFAKSEAFKAFLSAENRPNIVLIGKIEYADNHMLFKFTDMDTNETYLADLSVSDRIYTITQVDQ